MLSLYLCRHGNTFAPGDAVTWIGKNEDLPLVASGMQQAESMATHFIAQGIKPAAIYCSTLKRTQQYAAIIVEKLLAAYDYQCAPIVVEPALDELDYGDWGGKTSEAITARYGVDVLHNWSEHGIFPAREQGNWGDSEAEVSNRIASLYDRIVAQWLDDSERTVVVISSNGILRYFLHQVPGAYAAAQQAGTLKMKTGQFGRLTIDVQRNAELQGWGSRPLP